MSAFDPSPVEFLALDALDALIERKLGVLGEACRTSPFQAARLPDALTRSSLMAVPVLFKEDWLKATPPRGEGALTAPLGSAYVFRTGGSTGEPKFAFYSVDEFRTTIEQFKLCYGAAGLRSGDRVANLFAAGSLYASFVFINRLLEEGGCLNFPYTTSATPESVADGVALFGINVLLGFPSWLLEVAPVLHARGLKIEKVFYAGEHLHGDDRERLQTLLGCETIASAGYAAVDSGLVGYPCAASTGGVHHVLAAHAYIEILDPETLMPVPTGAPGLLVVTNLDRQLHPVVRYAVGDVARLVEGACACGRTAPRFELLGRGDDALRLAYATVTRAEILQVLADEAVAPATLQLVKRRVEGREALVLRYETATPDATRDVRLVALVLAAKPDVAKLVSAGTLAPVTVEAVAPGQIPRVAVTGKFRGTIDESI